MTVPPLFRLTPWPVEATEASATPAVLELTGQDAHHAVAVRRLRPGERVDITDGEGRLAETVVAQALPGRLRLAVEAVWFIPAPQPRLTVVQSLVKGARSELAAELLTEVGVDEIVPWPAQRCIARWTPGRSERRWLAAAEEAAKQSRRVHWPLLAAPVELPALARRVSAASRAVLLDVGAELSLPDLDLPGDGELLVIVGPEGGLDDAERDVLLEAGAVAVSLGPTVLRASTAGIVAASVLSAAAGRWRHPGHRS